MDRIIIEKLIYLAKLNGIPVKEESALGEIEKLKKENETVKAENERLQERLNKIEALLDIE